jgi:hypothetical protein
MRKLLKEISVIPGVVGSCIFDKSEGPLCKDVHPDLSQELLETVGIHLVRLVQMGRMIDLQSNAVHFRFDKCTVVGLPLESGAVLLTICDAQANCSLVATTAAMLASDMRDELAKGVSEARMQEAVEEVVEEEIATRGASEIGAEVQGLIKDIEQILATAIGPVAGLVIHDYVDKWRKDGPAVPARLGELSKMLEEEIGDPAMMKDFSTKVAKLI